MQPIRTLDGWIEPEVNAISGERRSRPRYALELAMRYQVLGEEPAEGSGITRDLSTGGVSFEVQETLRAGAQVVLTIDWPVALRGNILLEVVVDGCIVWCGNGVAAIRTTRCQFRHQAKTMTAGGYPLP